MARDRVNKPHIMRHQIFAQMPQIPLEFTNNIGDWNYWLALVAELIKLIPQYLLKPLIKMIN